MLEKQNELVQLKKKLDQEKKAKEDATIRATLQLRNPRTRSSSTSSSSSVTAASNSTLTTFMPVAELSRKCGHFGRPPTILTEHQKENVRYHVHLMLAERIYSTLDKVLTRIMSDEPGFPIRSTSSLWQWMKKIGFAYKRTSKFVVPLDSPFYMAARARYFSNIDELRNDETWCNQNEEKIFVCTDRDTGAGRLRQSSGKGRNFLS
ncbi:unnamed protein product [Rotaria sp. Silwood2]|nr:unnamed protein product [Rotaria sp. Silwood2]CAF4232965.1 unnamed protein product [Rotaria sp. Silwood2]